MLAAWLNGFKTYLKTAANKWRDEWSFARDADLVRVYAEWMAADCAMAATTDPDERDAILTERWAPAHAALCTLPAHTPRGLRIKIQVLLSEHENGASAWGADLRRTTKAAMGIPPE